jgi:hypothetical protein
MSSQPEPYNRVQEMACFCGICRPLDPHIKCERFTAAEILKAASDRLRGKLDKQRQERVPGPSAS